MGSHQSRGLILVTPAWRLSVHPRGHAEIEKALVIAGVGVSCLRERLTLQLMANMRTRWLMFYSVGSFRWVDTGTVLSPWFWILFGKAVSHDSTLMARVLSCGTWMAQEMDTGCKYQPGHLQSAAWPGASWHPSSSPGDPARLLLEAEGFRQRGKLLLLSVQCRFSYLKLNICLGPDDFEDSPFPVWPLDHGSPASHLLLVGTWLARWETGCFRLKAHALLISCPLGLIRAHLR